MEQDLVLDFTGVYASEKDHMPKTMELSRFIRQNL